MPRERTGERREARERSVTLLSVSSFIYFYLMFLLRHSEAIFLSHHLYLTLPYPAAHLSVLPFTLLSLYLMHSSLGCTSLSNP